MTEAPTPLVALTQAIRLLAEQMTPDQVHAAAEQLRTLGEPGTPDAQLYTALANDLDRFANEVQR